jgi:hypothetical protein
MAAWLFIEAFTNDASASNFSHFISLTTTFTNSNGGASAIESGIIVQINWLLPDLHYSQM